MAWGSKSRHERGYDYQWEQARKPAIIRDKELCQPCLKEGRVTRYASVDHIVPKDKARRMGWTRAQQDALSNLQCICDDCHKAKTAKENGGGTYRPKRRYGVDGWPIEE